MLMTPADSERHHTLVVAGMLAGGVVLAFYLASYLFLVKLHSPLLPPYAATPFTVLAYWQQYGDDPYTRRWLVICLVGGWCAAIATLVCLMRPAKRSLHGDARFATRREVAAAGLFDDDGLVLGRWGGLFGMGGKLITLGQQRGAFCAAGPRTGKGAGLVQPNALSWRGSFVINDTRKECYRITAGWRSLFSKVFLFDPLAPDGCTAQWNPISRFYVPDEPALRINALQKIANMLSPDPASGDPFWPASCRDLFLGLALYVIETPVLPRTLGEMLRQIMYGEAEGIGEHWRGVIARRDGSDNPLSPTCKRMLYDFIHLSPQTQSSIRKTFTAKLQLWANPLVDAATSTDSFNLCDLRRERISIYFGVNPGDLGRLGLLLNLFFTQLYDCNMDKMPEDDPTLKHEVAVIKDEFTAMGRMPIVLDSIGLMGGYGLRAFIIVQAVSQLRQVYGADGAETIMSCCGASVIFAPREQKYAEDISRMLGPYTAEVVSRSRQRFTFSSKAGGGSSTVSQVARPLMNPQEVKQMGKNHEIIAVEGMLPILCKKIWFWKLGLFAARANLPVPAIRPISVELTSAPVACESTTSIVELSAGAAPTRSVTPGDFGKLGNLNLTAYAVDFSKVELPKGEPITDDDLKKAFGSFMKAVESSQEQ
ncbi:type IV secretory system conjugative DNA transfer family protein [Massilia pinisoli]|uniref:Type IV secretory system conjugative DNA transfer family protein n=1 Tax=Massilia pinisoli TaxID=1772194 RepID=A0ABT1ZZR2_9BURK|nr:type IV secretory system conjugative DNA transfer family protein [Massilia pinisoli]MCS0585418.1 type IV secretory system conjugative DNA transfer family protein [Massilia pinisoli]